MEPFVIESRVKLDILTFGKRVVSLLNPLTTCKSRAKTPFFLL
jgi:hypothetical protein